MSVISPRARDLLATTSVLGALLWIFGRLVLTDPILTRDDRTLLKPLRSISNLADYLQAWRQHRILDLQPLRDASFLLDLKLDARTGLQTFHATNLLLWIAIVVMTWKIMTLSYRSDWLTALGVAVFAVHPVFVGSVAWISARKHLLSCVFILGATFLFERSRKTGPTGPSSIPGIFVLYVASTLAQPITALWPLWGAVVLVLDRASLRNRLWVAVILSAIAMIGVLAANFAYYTGTYEHLTTTSKFVDSGRARGVGLLALGRYVGNFVWPLRLATQYGPGSWIELFGLGCAVAVAILLRLLGCAREGLKWAGFFAFPLLLVTARMTNVYVSDTYALTSGVGLLGMMLAIVSRATQLHPRVGPLFVSVALLLFGVLTSISRMQAHTWASDSALWAQAQRAEPTPTTAAKHAYYLLQEGRREEAEQLLHSIPREERIGEVASVLGKAVYDAPSLSADEKLRRLRDEPESPWRNYYLAALEAQRGQFEAAFSLMREAFAGGPHFGDDLPIIAAETDFFCRRAGAEHCEGYLASVQLKLGGWDEARYRDRLARLGL